MKIILVLTTVFIAGSYAAALFEGDIVLDDGTRREMNGASTFDGLVKRHWPKGVVPYVFDSKFSWSSRKAVEKAIADYNAKTCIRFIPRTNEAGYVRFFTGSGCYSNVGRIGRKQDISIGRGCTSHGTVVHEMMHAIGFYHEQSRLDRDSYVTIFWENIKKGMESNFKKYRHGVADYYGGKYDYNSVMHYSGTSFGSGKTTIQAKPNKYQSLGQRRGFSVIDLQQINNMYKCSSNPNPNPITNPPQTKPPITGCVDNTRACPGWASTGYCNVNPKYMNVNCRKSCKLC